MKEQRAKHDMRVSIILPVKNGEKFIKDSVGSLKANMSPDDEIIVINDGSTDSTPEVLDEVLKGTNNTVICQNNLGPARARNLGIEKARGQYITFIDHDDLWPEGRLDYHLALFGRFPDSDVVVGKTQYFSSEERQLQNFRFVDDENALHHVHLGASTFRKKAFDMVGMFNGALNFSEDHDLFLRIRELELGILFDNKISLRYRVHDTNMTLNKSIKELEVLKVLHDSIKRRRTEDRKSFDIKPFGGQK